MKLVIDGATLVRCEADDTDEIIVVPEGVRIIDDCAFKEVTAVKQIILPSTLRKIKKEAFSMCSDLESINIPSSVSIIMKEAFSYCYNLKSIELPDGVTTIADGTFRNCVNLKRVRLSPNTTKIGDNAFLRCKRLTDINLSSNISEIGKFAFNLCDGLLGSNGLFVFNNTIYNSSNTATTLKIPDTVTDIGYRVFYNRKQLDTIIIGNGITRIPEYTFDGCFNLQNIFIPGSVTSLDYDTFEGCYSLLYVILGHKNPGMLNWRFYIRPITTKIISVDNYIESFMCVNANNAPLITAMINANIFRDYDTQNKVLSYLETNKSVEVHSLFLDYISRPDIKKMRQETEELRHNRKMDLLNTIFNMKNPSTIKGKVFIAEPPFKTFTDKEEFKFFIESCGASLYKVGTEYTEPIYMITKKKLNKPSSRIIFITENEFNAMVERTPTRY